jgi:hypothetical protein
MRSDQEICRQRLHGSAQIFNRQDSYVEWNEDMHMTLLQKTGLHTTQPLRNYGSDHRHGSTPTPLDVMEHL